MIVVFDTTVLHRDVHATRSLMRAALEGAANGDWSIVVPGVVIDEAVRQYPGRLTDTLRQLRHALSANKTDLQALGLPAPEAPIVDELALVAAYEANLRATLSGQGCIIADAPPETELVGSWAATRRAPFKADGTGTCDAFVWLTVLDQTANDEVLLVSANSKDFGDPDTPSELAPALIEDLEERGIAPERVRRVATIHQLLVELRTPEQQALERARAILNDAVRRQRLIAQISLQASWTPSQWDSVADWNLGAEVEEFALRAFDADDLNLESAEIENDGSLTMLLSASGSGSFDFFIEKSEALYLPDGSPVEIYDSNWNDWYHWAQATIPALVEIDVRVVDGDEFQISIENVEPA